LLRSGTTAGFSGGYPSERSTLVGKKGGFNHPSVSPLNFASISERYDLLEFYSRLVKDFDPQQAFELPCPGDLKYEIARTMQALIYWEFTPGDKFYTKDEILKGTLILGQTFTSRLKDEWDYGIRASHRVMMHGRDYRDWKGVSCYNSLPPVHYLINWAEDPEDYKYMSIPLTPFKMLDEFEETLRDLLPEDLEMPDEADILADVKNSVSLDLPNRKKIPFYKARLSPEGSRFSRVFKAQRCLVPVGAGNTRDTVVTTVDTFNTVSMVDKIILGVLDTIDESLVNSSPSKFNRKLREASKKSYKRIYYLRDIKKCGLTFPRELFHSVQKILSEVYPEKDFSYFDIYRNYSVYMEDWTLLDSTRGYCLGMANNLVTLCQCVMFEMLRRRTPEYLDIQGFFGNDDSIISIDSILTMDLEQAASIVETIDADILEGLNVMRHPDKTFWSVWPIIFEEYGHSGFSEKESRLAMALSSAKLAPDIKMAKCIVNALSPMFNGGEAEQRILSDIIYHFGYEYFPGERDYSYSLGGWYTHLSDGCELSLREIEKVEDPELIWNLYRSKLSVESWRRALSRVPHTSREGGKSFSPIGRTYEVWVKDPEFDTKTLPYSSINQSIEDFKKYQQEIYDLSRDLRKGILLTYKRYQEPHIPRESVSKTDLMVSIFKSGGNLAIPESLVTESTYIYTSDFVNVFSPNPLLKSRMGLRELVQLGDKYVRIERDKDIDVVGYTGCAEVSELPRLAKDQFSVILEAEDLNKSILQFSTNPDVPLQEYIRRFKKCPTSTIKMVDIGDRERALRLHKIDIRSEQEFRWSLGLLDILPDNEISEYLEEQRIQRLMDSEPDDDLSSGVELCIPHQTSGLAGVDQELSYINIVSIDCMLCSSFQELFRAISSEQHSLSEDERSMYRSIIPGKKSRLKSLYKLVGYDPDEIWVLREEVPDLFDTISEGDDNIDEGGMFSMFD
jgi:hypothetical protein